MNPFQIMECGASTATGSWTGKRHVRQQDSLAQ